MQTYIKTITVNSMANAICIQSRNITSQDSYGFGLAKYFANRYCQEKLRHVSTNYELFKIWNFKDKLQLYN